jgi:hypothetical protein
MAYTKNTWNTGDIVSSQKLNRMEDGIANSENVFIVGGATYDFADDKLAGTLDKTWQEIHDALQSKICVIVATDGDNARSIFISAALANPYAEEGDARYKVVTSDHDEVFITDSKDGYPAVYVEPVG